MKLQKTILTFALALAVTSGCTNDEQSAGTSATNPTDPAVGDSVPAEMPVQGKATIDSYLQNINSRNAFSKTLEGVSVKVRQIEFRESSAKSIEATLLFQGEASEVKFTGPLNSKLFSSRNHEGEMLSKLNVTSTCLDTNCEVGFISVREEASSDLESRDQAGQLLLSFNQQTESTHLATPTADKSGVSWAPMVTVNQAIVNRAAAIAAELEQAPLKFRSLTGYRIYCGEESESCKRYILSLANNPEIASLKGRILDSVQISNRRNFDFFIYDLEGVGSPWLAIPQDTSFSRLKAYVERFPLEDSIPARIRAGKIQQFELLSESFKKALGYNVFVIAFVDNLDQTIEAAVKLASIASTVATEASSGLLEARRRDINISVFIDTRFETRKSQVLGENYGIHLDASASSAAMSRYLIQSIQSLEN
jgi:hypothetical protein